MFERFEKFSFIIASINRSLHKIAAEEMVSYGLKGSFAFYLAAMHSRPEGVTAAQLSELCERDKAAVSRVLSEMESMGLIKREGAAEKNYRTLIVLTDEGRKAADYVVRRATLAVEEAGCGLTDENRAIFYQSIELIASNLVRIADNGMPQE